MEIHLRKRKWFICCSYNPNKHNISKHIQALSKSIDLFSSNYEYILLMRDNNPSCIDLLLTNFPKHFQDSSVIETGLSNFQKLVVTVKKTNIRKFEPKKINYRNYRYFSNDRFREKVTFEL